MTRKPDDTYTEYTCRIDGCGMVMPDAAIYKEQHNYKVHGIGAPDAEEETEA